MSSVANAYDNALCESFFAAPECELLEQRCLSSQAEAKMACFSFIEGYSSSEGCRGWRRSNGNISGSPGKLKDCRRTLGRDPVRTLKGCKQLLRPRVILGRQQEPDSD